MPEEILPIEPPSVDPPVEDPPPPPLPLPIPELPAGAIQVTFQANVPGYPPTVAVIHPRLAQKMVRLVADTGEMVDGHWVPRWPGMTEMFMSHVTHTLFSELEARYPDSNPELEAARAALAALEEANRNKPTFIGV